jgi:hypothetical protein
VHLWVVLFRGEGREEQAAVAQNFSETSRRRVLIKTLCNKMKTFASYNVIFEANGVAE